MGVEQIHPSGIAEWHSRTHAGGIPFGIVICAADFQVMGHIGMCRYRKDRCKLHQLKTDFVLGAICWPLAVLRCFEYCSLCISSKAAKIFDSMTWLRQCSWCSSLLKSLALLPWQCSDAVLRPAVLPRIATGARTDAKGTRLETCAKHAQGTVSTYYVCWWFWWSCQRVNIQVFGWGLWGSTCKWKNTTMMWWFFLCFFFLVFLNVYKWENHFENGKIQSCNITYVLLNGIFEAFQRHFCWCLMLHWSRTTKTRWERIPQSISQIRSWKNVTGTDGANLGQLSWTTEASLACSYATRIVDIHGYRIPVHTMCYHPCASPCIGFPSTAWFFHKWWWVTKSHHSAGSSKMAKKHSGVSSIRALSNGGTIGPVGFA